MSEQKAPAIREVVVLSGKGGTGKTTVAASLAVLAKLDGLRAVSVDCDVDASNLYLMLHPTVEMSRDFSGGSVAVVDPKRCVKCGECVAKCLFGAMASPGQVDGYGCEGCGVCALVCPAGAVALERRTTGRIHRGRSAWGTVIWAGLQPGAGNSGKLAAEVREEARRSAHAGGATLIISDGPPGLGCPVISSLTGASLALLVTEPSRSGHHDLERIAGLCEHFRVPARVVINKASLNPERARAIRSWCNDRGLPLVGEIPFDAEVPARIAGGQPIVTETGNSPAAAAIRALWQRLLPCPTCDAAPARR